MSGSVATGETYETGSGNSFITYLEANKARAVAVRRTKIEKTFIYTPLKDAGAVRQSEHYQECLAEYCAGLGPPVKQQAAYLYHRKQQHRADPPWFDVPSPNTPGGKANFIEIYARTGQDRMKDNHALLGPANQRRAAVERARREQTELWAARSKKEMHMEDLSGKYGSLFEADRSPLEELALQKARARARARRKGETGVPDTAAWGAAKPMPHAAYTGAAFTDARGPAWERKQGRLTKAMQLAEEVALQKRREQQRQALQESGAYDGASLSSTCGEQDGQAPRGLDFESLANTTFSAIKRDETTAKLQMAARFAVGHGQDKWTPSMERLVKVLIRGPVPGGGTDSDEDSSKSPEAEDHEAGGGAASPLGPTLTFAPQLEEQPSGASVTFAPKSEDRRPSTSHGAAGPRDSRVLSGAQPLPSAMQSSSGPRPSTTPAGARRSFWGETAGGTPTLLISGPADASVGGQGGAGSQPVAGSDGKGQAAKPKRPAGRAAGEGEPPDRHSNRARPATSSPATKQPKRKRAAGAKPPRTPREDAGGDRADDEEPGGAALGGFDGDEAAATGPPTDVNGEEQPGELAPALHPSPGPRPKTSLGLPNMRATMSIARAAVAGAITSQAVPQSSTAAAAAAVGAFRKAAATAAVTMSTKALGDLEKRAAEIKDRAEKWRQVKGPVSQDEFVLAAGGGHLHTVSRALAQTKLDVCEVDGVHSLLGFTALYAAVLGLLQLEAKLAKKALETKPEGRMTRRQQGQRPRTGGTSAKAWPPEVESAASDSTLTDGGHPAVNPVIKVGHSRSHYEAIVKRLLDAGAQVNFRETALDASHPRSGWGPLHQACLLGTHRRVLWLLRNGATADLPDSNQTAPLMVAAMSGNMTGAVVLIAHGADLYGSDKVGMTPLHFAAMHGGSAVTKCLLIAGADREARTEAGHVPLDLALRQKRRVTADILCTYSYEQLPPRYYLDFIDSWEARLEH